MKKSIKNISRENEKECYVMDLRIEYGAGKVGREDYAIITDMSEVELKAAYGDELHQYEPYVVMTMEMGEAIFEYNRNEWKNEKRQHKYGSEYSISEPDFDEHHPECAEEPDYLSCLEKSEKYAPLYEALSKLTDVQNNRIIKYFFEHKTMAQISGEENVSKQSIFENLESSLEKLKELLTDSELGVQENE